MKWQGMRDIKKKRECRSGRKGPTLVYDVDLVVLC